MQSLKYFEQEGNTYHMKIQKGMYYFLSLLAFAGAVAALIYGTAEGLMYLQAAF